MKARMFIAIFLLGVVIGVVIFSQPAVKEAVTGRAMDNCYVNNEPCNCNHSECVCGNKTVSASYCALK